MRVKLRRQNTMRRDVWIDLPDDPPEYGSENPWFYRHEAEQFGNGPALTLNGIRKIGVERPDGWLQTSYTYFLRNWATIDVSTFYKHIKILSNGRALQYVTRGNYKSNCYAVKEPMEDRVFPPELILDGRD